MEFAVDRVSCSIHHLEGVATIPIHMGVSIWNTSVAKEEGHLVGGFWAKGDEVPEHIRVLK